MVFNASDDYDRLTMTSEGWKAKKYFGINLKVNENRNKCAGLVISDLIF